MTVRIFLLTFFSALSLKAQAIIKACAPFFGKPPDLCNGQCPSCYILQPERKSQDLIKYPVKVYITYRPSLEFDPENYTIDYCVHCRNAFAMTVEEIQ